MDSARSQGRGQWRGLVHFLWCAWVKLANRGSLWRLHNLSSIACYSLSALHSSLDTHTHTYLIFIPIPVCNRLINRGNFHLLPALAERNRARQGERRVRESMPELLISCAVEIGQTTLGSVSQTAIHSVNMTLMAVALLLLLLSSSAFLSSHSKSGCSA